MDVTRTLLHFGGASPELTRRFYTQGLPGQNEGVVAQMWEAMSPAGVIVSQGKYQHLFAQDTQWVFSGEGDLLTIRHKPDNTVPDAFTGGRLEPLQSNLYGGNAYIGITDSKKPYTLVGERVVSTSGQNGLEKIATDLGLSSPAAITVIPQEPAWYQNDIDTFIRPLTGNTLLVYDPEEAQAFLERNGLQKLSAVEGPADHKERSFRNIQALLESRGFRVIKAPGLFHYKGRMATGQTTEFDMSLLNGLVYRDPESKRMVYLTMDPAKPDLKTAFAEWLKENTEVDDVVYIDGDAPRAGLHPYPNRMIQIFNEEKGGLHCMFGEVIDGSLWKSANQS